MAWEKRRNGGLDTRPGEAVLALACLFLWVTVFAVGVLVPSADYRAGLIAAPDLRTFFAALLTFTFTNVGVLTCLAGLLGGIASRLTFKDYELSPESDEDTRGRERRGHTLSHAYRTENPIAGMLRGFVTFLVYMAGLAIGMPGGTNGDASGADIAWRFNATTPDQYARLAALLSAIAFGAGYDPTMFRSIWGLVPPLIGRKRE